MIRSVSWYSFLSAMIFFSMALIIIFVLRSRIGFLKKHGVSILLFACVLALVRLILPLDLPFAYICRSWVAFPAIKVFFREHGWVPSLLLAIWGIGAVAVLTKDIRSLIRAHAICRDYTIIEEFRVDQIAKSISIECPVLVSPNVKIPYVAGLFRHTIYLPSLELSDREMELILIHENQHIKSHDSQIKLFWGLLSAVFWWNPIIYKFRKEIDALLEFRCDAKVTNFMGTEGQIQYLEMLLSIMKQTVDSLKGPTLSLYESSTLSSPCIAEQRFMIIADNLGKKPQRVSLAVKCVLMVLFFASYLVVLQPASLAPIEEGELQFAFRQEIGTNKIEKEVFATFIVKVGDKYYLVIEGQQNQELSPGEVFSDTYKDYIIMEEYAP